MRLSRSDYLLIIIISVLLIFIALDQTIGGPALASSPKTMAGLPSPNPTSCLTAGTCTPCPVWLATNTCELTVSYLKSLTGEHLPILVHRKTVIVWFGDHKENLNVKDLTGADCKDEHQPNPKAPAKPTEKLVNNGSDYVVALIKDNSKYEKFCYKHNITYTDNTGTYPIDPHIYVGTSIDIEPARAPHEEASPK